jgi:TPR repeat protein
MNFEFWFEAQPSSLSSGNEDDDAAEFDRAESCQICLRNAAEQGDVLAQDMLAWLYCDRTRGIQGDPEDNAEAVKWSRKAAEQGRAASQFHLAWMYYEGTRGVQQDYTEAMKWFLSAADQSYDIAVMAAANFRLGEMYYKGEGLPVDYTEAVRRYQRAARQNHDRVYMEDARLKLAEIYYNGFGVPRDYIQAYVWVSLILRWNQFHSRATAIRDELAATMAPSHIAEALRLIDEWKEQL